MFGVQLKLTFQLKNNNNLEEHINPKDQNFAIMKYLKLLSSMVKPLIVQNLF